MNVKPRDPKLFEFMAEKLTQSLKIEAKRLGFDLVGCCPAVTPAGFSSFKQWLESGYEGEMHYLRTRQDAYEHPRYVLDGCRSVVMLGMSYHTGVEQVSRPGGGKIAKYAWGRVDYHDLIHDRLKKLVAFLDELNPDIRARGVVDTAPLLERDFAQMAGLGWQAKNTMLINREFGSWFFLAAVLVDIELDYDLPFQQNHCGTCTACLEACPTDAFVEPGKMDARRCISYLTIEHRSEIDAEFEEGIGDWLFGCDICQDVCPWNNKAKLTSVEEFQPDPRNNPVDLQELMGLSEKEFRERYRKTPMWRAKHEGLVRNAKVVIRNQSKQSEQE